jgi:hypothetical protein
VSANHNCTRGGHRYWSWIAPHLVNSPIKDFNFNSYRLTKGRIFSYTNRKLSRFKSSSSFSNREVLPHLRP